MQTTIVKQVKSPISMEPAMRTQPRLKLLVTCMGIALAQWAPGSAMADSGVGVDTALGNALNPPGRSAIPRPVAADGYDTVRRSPSGQLYGLPPDVNDDTTTTAGGWQYKGGIDVGVLGGDANTRSTKFREYKDIGNGLYLNYFDLEAEKPDTANFLQAFGGGTGHNDQFYSLQFGRYNDWKTRLFYNETPHVFSSNFKPILTNNGTSTPTLDNGTPGGAGAVAATGAPAGATAAQIAAAQGANLIAYAKTLPDTEVGLVRKKGGIRFDKMVTDNWKVFGSYTRENREGERPFGFQDGNVEGVEPINYATNDFLAGASYADKLTSFNLLASASLFRNEIDYLYNRKALVAANGAPGTIAAIDYGSYTLAPDNNAFNLKGEYARKLPDFYKGRFSASVAWGTNRQDDAIRTPIRPDDAGFSSANIVQAAANGLAFNANNWNGVNGSPTSRSSSGLRLDTSLLNLSLSLNPLDELHLKGTYRHFETQNKSGTYYAYNPLTGQWGYGIQEGAFNTVAPLAMGGGTGCQPAPGFTLPVPGCTTGAVFATANPRSYFSPPRDNKQTNITMSADYDLGNTSSVEGVYERENFAHTYRERDETWEDKLKLTYVNRSLGNATLRMSYEDDRKRGSFYDPLVVTRSLVQDWMAFYGISYSRAALADMITKAGTGIYPTLPLLQTALVSGGGQFNTGGFMKSDQADRDQNIFNTRINYMPREDIDVGAMVQIKRARYPTNGFGAQRDDLNSYNLDFNYQANSATQFSAFVSRQEGKQLSIDNYATDPASGLAFTAATMQTYITPICGAALSMANLDCYLNNQRAVSSNVAMETKNTTNVIGFGLTHDFGKVKFGANYTYSKGVTAIARAFGATALTAANKTVEATYGAWPDIVTTQNALDLNVLVPVNKKTSVRFLYRYESMALSDWHYDPLPTMTTNFVAADFGPQKYSTRLVGVFLLHTF